jgi:hypothetical protein
VTPRTQVVFNVETSDAVENGAYGFLFQAETSHLNVKGTIKDLETFDNTGNGIGVEVSKMEGAMNLYFTDVFAHENQGNGMNVKSTQGPFRDLVGTSIMPRGTLMMDFESCDFSSNEGNGVYETHNPSFFNDTATTENYKVYVKNSTVEKNNANGWSVNPQGQPRYGNRNGHYEFTNTLFSDNKGNGFYVHSNYQNYYYYGGGTEEVFWFTNCTFTYNQRGFRQYMGQYAENDQTEFHFDLCTFQDNDYEALYTTGYWYSYYDSGMSYFTRNEYFIQNSLLDGNVHLHISGLHDQYGNAKPIGTISIINCTYTSDEPMYLRIGAYYYAYTSPITANVIYKDNTHTSPSTGDGIHIEMYGGARLAANIDIQNMEIYDALGHGIRIRFGTLYRYTSYVRSVSGKVNMVNVDIRNPIEDGVYIDTFHRASAGASSSGFYSLIDSRIQGANTGIKTFAFSGEIRNTVFSNIRQETVYNYFGVIDIYASEVGPISEQNLRVDEKGAIRLWFELTVKEKQVHISETMEITIKLVDDILPRLTVETPVDGHEQREQSVTVKGTVYDKHTGVDKVEVSIDGTTWFEAQLSADKFTYEYTFEELPEGLVLLRVRGYDIAGNMREAAISILVDSTPPTLGVITPEDGMRTNKRYLEIVGVTDVGSQVYINDQPIDIQYTLISHTLILAEGPNAIKVASVDYLGNIAEIVRYVTLDTQAPYIDIINVNDGDSVNMEELTIIGLTEEEDVTVTVNGMEVEVDEGKFEATVTLREGANDISIYAIDGVENDRLIMLTVHLDQTAPWLRLTEPIVDTLTDNNFKVSGYVEQGSRVYVNDREVEVSFGYFETTVSAPEGAFDLEISALDGAGNELVRVIPLTVDTLAPAIEVTYPTEGFVTNLDTVTVMGTITGTRNEDMRYLELYINGIPRLFDYTSGEFSHEVLLEEGVNRIVIESMDTVPR